MLNGLLWKRIKQKDLYASLLGGHARSAHETMQRLGWNPGPAASRAVNCPSSLLLGPRLKYLSSLPQEGKCSLKPL